MSRTPIRRTTRSPTEAGFRGAARRLADADLLTVIPSKAGIRRGGHPARIRIYGIIGFSGFPGARIRIGDLSGYAESASRAKRNSDGVRTCASPSTQYSASTEGCRRPRDAALAARRIRRGLFIVGPVEEFSKFLAVRLGAYRSLRFDEPGDGLVYAAASLGFASIENLGCAWTFGPAVMIVRAPLSTAARTIRRVLGRRRRAAGGVRRSWDVQHNGVRAAARRNRADGGRRAVDAVEIRLGAARLAVPIQAQLPQNRLRRLRTAHSRDKPILPLLRNARRQTPPSRRAVLRKMRRSQQAGRRLLRCMRGQVRFVRDLRRANRPREKPRLP